MMLTNNNVAEDIAAALANPATASYYLTTNSGKKGWMVHSTLPEDDVKEAQHYFALTLSGHALYLPKKGLTFAKIDVAAKHMKGVMKAIQSYAIVIAGSEVPPDEQQTFRETLIYKKRSKDKKAKNWKRNAFGFFFLGQGSEQVFTVSSASDHYTIEDTQSQSVFSGNGAGLEAFATQLIRENSQNGNHPLHFDMRQVSPSERPFTDGAFIMGYNQALSRQP